MKKKKNTRKYVDGPPPGWYPNASQTLPQHPSVHPSHPHPHQPQVPPHMPSVPVSVVTQFSSLEKLAQDPHGSVFLLNNSFNFGLSVSRATIGSTQCTEGVRGNVIQLGVVNLAELPNANVDGSDFNAPGSDKGWKVLSIDLCFAYAPLQPGRDMDKRENVLLEHWDLYPDEACVSSTPPECLDVGVDASAVPHLRVAGSTGAPPSLPRLHITSASTTGTEVLPLELVIPVEYSGDLRKLVVCKFRQFGAATQDMGPPGLGLPLAATQVVFLAAFRLVGRVVAGAVTGTAAVNGGLVLSSEARAFRPDVLVKIFDSMAPTTFFDRFQQDSKRLFNAPLSYAHLLRTREDHYCADAALRAGYMEACRHHRLAAFASALQLQSINSTLLGAQSNGDSGGRLRRRYLGALKCLMLCEELQMAADICSYDLYNIPLVFEPCFQAGGDRTGTLTARIFVKGSSESRPKVQIGTRLRLRAEHRRCMFELQGVVVRFVLAQETAVCEFYAPSAMPGAGAVGLTEESAKVLAILNSLPYHIRFGYERLSHVFVQTALASLLPAPGSFRTDFCWGRYLSDLQTGRVEPEVDTDHLSEHANAMLERLFPSDSRMDRLAAALRQRGVGCGIGASTEQELHWQDASSTSKDAACDLNPEQEHAVRTVGQLVALQQEPTDVTSVPPLPPFVIFGPPGTGKTATLIRTVVELCMRHPSVSILLCAPSDAAADVLTQRLIEAARWHSLADADAKDSGSVAPALVLVRLVWWQRALAFVRPSIRPYCVHGPVSNAGAATMFDFPTTEALRSCNVVVSTCGVAGTLQAQAEQLLFDCVIVDEASQALEAEVLVPLTLCRTGAGTGAQGRSKSVGVGPGVMVLAGDVNQLGPTTRSPLFRLCGVVSLQERLLRLAQYRDCVPAGAGMPNPNPSTGSALYIATDSSEHPRSPMGVFLHRNYRSHPDILRLPSALFYNSALRACGDSALLSSCLQWEPTLQIMNNGGGTTKDADSDRVFFNPRFACQFLSVPSGQHRHEVDSPSYFNAHECNAVVLLCKELVGARLKVPTVVDADTVCRSIAPHEIGVICAFRQQVLRTRLQLRAASVYLREVQAQSELGSESAGEYISLGGVVVGSVEDFQGQEFKVIITSTVLADTDTDTNIQTQEGLGLMNDPRKFNVAVTRAQCLNIVVGHPLVLGGDRLWREYMRLCLAHGAVLSMDAAGTLTRGLVSTAQATDAGTAGDHSQSLSNRQQVALEVLSKELGGGRNDEFDEMLRDMQVHRYEDIGQYLNQLAGDSAPVAASSAGERERVPQKRFLHDLEWRDML